MKAKLPDFESAPVRRGMFLTLLLLVTTVFFGLISSFLMACFWAAIFAVLFQEPYRWLTKRLGNNEDLAALLTCIFVVVAVVIPVGLISLAVVNESTALYDRFEAGDVSLDDVIDAVRSEIPATEGLLGRLGLTIDEVQSHIRSATTKAISIVGESTWRYTQGAIGAFVEFFLMLYLLFFWVRDGEKIIDSIRKAIPVGDEIENTLFKKFATVARATLKGTVIVAACQGLVGGILFAAVGIQGAILWGVLMGLLSLLPVGGSGIVWGPAAIILYFQGYVTEAIIIVVVGALGIGLIDNLLRPLLVGRETKLPDYLVLIATLGGIAWVGLSGFIIGPVIAALFVTCWQITGEIFDEERGAEESQNVKN